MKPSETSADLFSMNHLKCAFNLNSLLVSLDLDWVTFKHAILYFGLLAGHPGC